MRATLEFKEIILPYDPAARRAWVAGDKSLVPPGHPVPPDIANQTDKHFPEFFVLDHYRRSGGWSGYRWYVLCAAEDHGTEKYGPGGLALERVIPSAQLAVFRKLRSKDPLERKGKGEPDLFLYKSDGSVLFVEAKMDDGVDPYQLRCLAQIRSVLGCAAEIVRIVPEGRRVAGMKYPVEIEVPTVVSAQAPIRRQRSATRAE